MIPPRSVLAGVPLVALLALAACGGPTEAQKETSTAETQAAAQAQAQPTLSQADAYFLDQATQSGNLEMQTANLAEKRAPRMAIRNFAQDMVRDHTWVNDSLAKLAAAKNVNPPSGLTELQQRQVTHLDTLHGANFDTQFLDQQATAHQQAIELYRNEAQNGTDPDVKSFASQVLPRLEEHMSMIQKLGGRPMTG